MMYGEIFKESWRKLFSNLELFVPDIVLFVVSTIVASILLVLFVGNNPEISASLTEQGPLIFAEDVSEEVLSSFIESLDFSVILSALTYFIVFVIVTFFVGSGTDVMKFYMMRDLLTKKKITLSKSLLKGGKEFFWKYILLRIISYVVMFVAFFVLFLLMSLIGNITLGLVILSLLSFILLVFFILWFYFLVPILFLSKTRINDLFFDAFEFMRKNFSVVVVTILIVLAASIVGYSTGELFDYLSTITGLTLIAVVSVLLNLVITLVFSVWPQLFKFMIYSKVKKIKR